MSEQQQVEFECEGRALVGSWGIPPGVERDYPLVILATGDGPSGRKGQTWTQLVPMLLSRGLGTFLFDFTGLGDSKGVYEELTLTRGCQDFRAVMQYVQSVEPHDHARIGVIGASYGGNVALLEAARYPEIRAIGLKSPSTFLPEGYQIQYGAKLMEDWGREGYSEEVGLNYTAVIDALFHNTYESASHIQAQIRIVHGTADTAVPIRHSRDLVRVVPHGSMLEIEGADHWYAEDDEWQRMAEDLVAFMVDVL